MKATGIVRKVDELGRVVLPAELRQKLGIQEKDSLEIFVEGEKIILGKYEPGCVLCGETNHIRTVNGKTMCRACLDAIKTST